MISAILHTAMMKVIVTVGFLSLTTTAVFAQSRDDKDDSLLGRTFRLNFGRNVIGSDCEAGGFLGTCERRNNCRFPTNKICRSGFVPIVCCLPESPEKPAKPSTSRPRPQTPRPQTPRPPKTTVKPKPTTPKTPSPKPEDSNISDGGNVDVTFPGCGYRYPSAPQPPSSQGSSQGTRNRGILGRLSGRRRKRNIISCNRTDCQSDKIVRPKRQIRPVIVGGVNTGPDGYPWMVALFRKNSRNERFLCGASLISKRYVLTAAHCFDGISNLDTQKFSVRIGSHTTSLGTSYDVERVLRHPGYKSGQYYNDMSLLRLTKEASLTTKTFPVCLPSPSLRSKVSNGKKDVTVMGWGDTSFGGTSSKELMEVALPVVPLKECNSSYSTVAKRSFPNGITNVFICAGLKEGGKDACQGDSGGPLVMRLTDNTFVQLGIVSFGYGCAEAGYPGVYTRISKFTKWIRDNTDLG